MQEGKNRLGLYLHIPFCVRKCNYCDFLSAPATDEVRKAYVKALADEVAARAELVEDYGVRTIYVGGGTPSLLEVGEMEFLVTRCREALHIEDGDLEEFTVEVNPGTLDRDKLQAYRAFGVNRISFGLQSVHEDELALLGRIHGYEDFVGNYGWAREVGFDNISVDLMSGLPNQTMERLRESLETVCGLQRSGPEHVSVYGLTVEPGTVFARLYGEEPPVEEDLAWEMDRMVKEELEAKGYRRYEISNYAKEGFEAKHNQSYWERVDYLGLGLGASSLLGNVRYRNETDMAKYLEGAGQVEEHALSRQEQMEEFMFLGLRRIAGVGEGDFLEAFGTEVDAVYGRVIAKWEKEALLERSSGRIRLTERGLEVGNRVLADFLI